MHLLISVGFLHLVACLYAKCDSILAQAEDEEEASQKINSHRCFSGSQNLSKLSDHHGFKIHPEIILNIFSRPTSTQTNKVQRNNHEIRRLRSV